MKILFVTDLCPIRDDEKGLPLTLLNFIEDFKKFGHEVVLFRPNIIPNVLLRGRKILPEGIFEYKGIKCINKNYFTPFFSKKQFKFLKKEGFDVILSHMPSGLLAARKMSKALKIPYFASVHSSDIEVLTNKKYKFLWHAIKKGYLNAKNVFPRSYWLKDKIEEIMPELRNNTFLIPSGIEKEKLISREEINQKANKFYGMPYKILSVGSLIKRKNFELLIEAISEFDDVQLEIIGDGKNKKKLEKLVNNLNLSDRINFLGYKTKVEVLNLMKENSIFILPSMNETFGMVYLEALSQGMIVVCSKNSGMDGFIQDGKNGFITELTKESLVSVIEKIKNIQNPSGIMNNALDVAIELEREKMAKNYLNLIQNILF